MELLKCDCKECKVCLTLELDEVRVELEAVRAAVDEYLSGTLTVEEFRYLLYGPR